MCEHRNFLRIIVPAAVVTLATPAFAYRPFDGTDADVAATGEFELELGPVHWYSQGASHFLIAPATVLNLGVAPGWELVSDFSNFVALDPAPGAAHDQLLDTDVLLKVVIVRGSLQNAGPHPSVALEFGPLLPNIDGDKGFGASANLIESKRWNDLAIHVDNWFQLTRGDLHFDWFAGVILEGEPNASVRPVGELFVEREWVTGETTWSALAGAIWRAREGLDLDAGLREARVGDERASEVRLGLTWTVDVFAPRGQDRASRPERILFRR